MTAFSGWSLVNVFVSKLFSINRSLLPTKFSVVVSIKSDSIVFVISSVLVGTVSATAVTATAAGTDLSIELVFVIFVVAVAFAEIGPFLFGLVADGDFLGGGARLVRVAKDVGFFVVDADVVVVVVVLLKVEGPLATVFFVVVTVVFISVLAPAVGL